MADFIIKRNIGKVISLIRYGNAIGVECQIMPISNILGNQYQDGNYKIQKTIRNGTYDLCDFSVKNGKYDGKLVQYYKIGNDSIPLYIVTMADGVLNGSAIFRSIFCDHTMPKSKKNMLECNFADGKLDGDVFYTDIYETTFVTCWDKGKKFDYEKEYHNKKMNNESIIGSLKRSYRNSNETYTEYIISSKIILKRSKNIIKIEFE